jgi:hypothetical protein
LKKQKLYGKIPASDSLIRLVESAGIDPEDVLIKHMTAKGYRKPVYVMDTVDLTKLVSDGDSLYIEETWPTYPENLGIDIMKLILQEARLRSEV